jgi:hypothetical protein
MKRAKATRRSGGKQPRPKMQHRGWSSHFDGRGVVKVGWMTEARALEVAAEQQPHSRRTLAPYKCSECPLWHIGGSGRAPEMAE